MPLNTLLLVEDNELNRDMLSRRLERKGYVIQMAADGAQGVSMATELRPALILMDLSLPVMDGWEAIRRLKADPETATIPIIALTAHARAEDEKMALDTGANDFDTKPIDLNRLVGKIEHLLTPPATGTHPSLSAKPQTKNAAKAKLGTDSPATSTRMMPVSASVLRRSAATMPSEIPIGTASARAAAASSGLIHSASLMTCVTGTPG